MKYHLPRGKLEGFLQRGVGGTRMASKLSTIGSPHLWHFVPLLNRRNTGRIASHEGHLRFDFLKDADTIFNTIAGIRKQTQYTKELMCKMPKIKRTMAAAMKTKVRTRKAILMRTCFLEIICYSSCLISRSLEFMLL